MFSRSVSLRHSLSSSSVAEGIDDSAAAREGKSPISMECVDEPWLSLRLQTRTYSQGPLKIAPPARQDGRCTRQGNRLA
jgi:hypothetical protein